MRQKDNQKMVTHWMANALVIEMISMMRSRAGARFMAGGFAAECSAIDGEIEEALNAFIRGAEREAHSPTEFVAEIALGYRKAFSKRFMTMTMAKFPMQEYLVRDNVKQVKVSMRELIRRWIVAEIDFLRS